MNFESHETARELFSFLDKHEKGYIALDEISQLTDISEGFTQSQLYSVFSVLDKTGEGKITLQDFTEAFVTSGDVAENCDQNTEESRELILSTVVDCPNEVHDSRKSSLGSPESVDILLPVSRHENTEGLDIPCKQGGVPSSVNVVVSDDVFEGDGLLSLDSPVLSVSPSRSTVRGPVVRSPSLRRRQGSRPQLASKHSSEYDEQIRLPPDGGEGDSHRASPKHSKNNKGKAHRKTSSIDKQSEGFAKEAISDLLKIVDSQTLSNLGVYHNQAGGVWRHDINWNVPSDMTNNDMSNERTCPPWLRASMDWSENDGTSRPESRESKLTRDLQSSDLELTSVGSRFEDNDLTSSNSDLSSFHNHNSPNMDQPEAELDPTFDYPDSNSHSNLQQSAFSPISCSDNARSYEDFDALKSNQPPDHIEAQSSDYKMQVGANVDKNVIGNLIFDMGDGNHVGLYDRILNYSGVELNSRLSSSETSLHELLLEAEAVRNNSAHIEDWDLVMKRINGVSLFGGNQTLRYLWQQLSVYNSDLIQPFEDFLKSMINEFQRAYTKCQELDLALKSKAEQHEREMARMDDEMDQLLLREKDQLQEKHNEREEYQRCEFNRIIDLKENELQEALRNKAEVESRLEMALEDYHVLKAGKERTEKQLNKSVTAEAHQRQENENLLQENRTLCGKLSKCNRDYQEIQEHLLKMTKTADVNIENYRRCMRQFQDAVEEREYFDVNISNLTQELQDLRNANNVLQERYDTSLNSSIIWRDEQLAPKSPRSPRSPRIEDNLEGSLKSDKSPKTQPRRSSKTLAFSNGTTQISKNKRGSLVSEPSFEEIVQVIAPKSASTPVKIAKQIPVIPTGNEYKVIFVGDAAVGKSSLIRKMCRGTFNSQRVSTSGPDCQKKIVTVGNRSLALNLWDTVGQERCTYILKAEGSNQQLIYRFNSLPPSYFRKADVVVLVYDLIDEVSFISIKSWMKTINEYTDENVLLVLCGNKSDLDHRRQVKEDRALRLAKLSDAIYLETSAKNGYNLSKLCETIASTLMERDDTVFIREKSVQVLHQDYLNISRKKMTSCC